MLTRLRSLLTLVCICVLILALPLNAAPAAVPATGDGQAPVLGASGPQPPKEAEEAGLEAIYVGDHLPGAGAGPLTPGAVLGQVLVNESEPNNTAATADALGSNAVALGYIYLAGDIDYYAFVASPGDRVYAAVMTSFSASGVVDSGLQVIAPDGTTVLENDANDGTFGSTSSGIAGTRIITTTGTHYLRVEHATGASHIRPYHLHLRVQSGAPTAESEPNDAVATANPLPPNGWVTGAVTATTDLDFYSVTLNAGDTIYAGLDLDPGRDNTQWNGQLGVGIFGGFVLVINDASAGTLANPLSESHFMTAKTAGTYYVLVMVPTGGATIGDYRLSVSVLPAEPQTCRTYTSTAVPIAIPSGPAIVTSTLTIPGNPIIGDLNVTLNVSHTFMQDLDFDLRSPGGQNINSLVNDIGNATTGSTNIIMNLGLDDEAGVPAGTFTVVDGMVNQPELAYRLHWFDGEPAGGTWSLTVRDDAAGDGGTLLGWSMTICEPPPPPSCPSGTTLVTVYSSSFEADDGGFTHSGIQDEWARGLPTGAPIASCASGTNCWETDLTGTYNASSSQNLSRTVDLTPFAGSVVSITWAQKYQMESASFDHAYFEVVGSTTRRLWEFRDATMTSVVGNPTVTLQESAGWGRFTADISDMAGAPVLLRFHLDSDSSVQLDGYGVDDVTVQACMAQQGNQFDGGDAPDGCLPGLGNPCPAGPRNHGGGAGGPVPMVNGYGGVAGTGQFPTVWGSPPLPPSDSGYGLCHAYGGPPALFLGPSVSAEFTDTDLPPDSDTVTNILTPPLPTSYNMDGADNGTAFPPGPVLNSFPMTVFVSASGPGFVNLWIDWTRDGDWLDGPGCGLGSTEWAAMNVPVVAGVNAIMVTACQPGLGGGLPLSMAAWMRTTLTPGLLPVGFPYTAGGQPAPGGPGGACFVQGETEDRLVAFGPTAIGDQSASVTAPAELPLGLAALAGALALAALAAVARRRLAG